MGPVPAIALRFAVVMKASTSSGVAIGVGVGVGVMVAAAVVAYAIRKGPHQQQRKVRPLFYEVNLNAADARAEAGPPDVEVGLPEGLDPTA